MKIIKSQNYSNSFTGQMTHQPAPQKASPTIAKLKQIKQLLDEIGGEMQAEVDETKKEEMSNWIMELRRTLDGML
jgi:hypothetical protein